MRTDRKSTVKVGYRDYVIKFAKKIDGDTQGLCDKLAPAKTRGHDYEKGHITIKKGMDDVEKANVVFHELLHAIFTERGLIYKTKEEETIVLAMTNGIIDFIRDNPRFFNRLLKLLK